MAPPKKEINDTQVYKLAQLMCTHEEIASFFNVSTDTVARRYAELIKRGQETGKMSLRRKQWKLADKSAGMCIWLGKQYLDQVDTKEIVIPDADKYFQKIADAIMQSDTDPDSLLQRQSSFRS